MIKGLMQRLLGAMVLLGLLVILAPAIFSGGQDHPLVRAELEPMVPAPEPPSHVGVLDVEADPVDVREYADRMPEEDISPPGVDQNGHLKAWSLQLASFSEQENASALVEKLKTMGHSSYSRKIINANGKPLFRVFIGPEVRTDELQALKAKMQKELGLVGIIVRFET